MGNPNWQKGKRTLPVCRILSNRVHLDKHFVLFEWWYWNLLNLYSLALFKMTALAGSRRYRKKVDSTSWTTRAFIVCGIKEFDILMSLSGELLECGLERRRGVMLWARRWRCLYSRDSFQQWHYAGPQAKISRSVSKSPPPWSVRSKPVAGYTPMEDGMYE